MDSSKLSDASLREALAFFDCEQLRGHYTGLLADLRAEQSRRQSQRWLERSQQTFPKGSAFGDAIDDELRGTER